VPALLLVCIAIPLVVSLYFIFWLIALIIRVIIETKVGWSNHTTLGKVATIIFALDASIIFQIFTPPPLPQILFIIDRVREADLPSVGIAWVILSILASGWTMSVVLFTSIVSPIHIFYRAWLESFDESWPASSSWKWKFFVWLEREDKRFMMRALRWVHRERSKDNPRRRRLRLVEVLYLGIYLGLFRGVLSYLPYVFDDYDGIHRS
jgi:hypothetical protein